MGYIDTKLKDFTLIFVRKGKGARADSGDEG